MTADHHLPYESESALDGQRHDDDDTQARHSPRKWLRPVPTPLNGGADTMPEVADSQAQYSLGLGHAGLCESPMETLVGPVQRPAAVKQFQAP